MNHGNETTTVAGRGNEHRVARLVVDDRRVRQHAPIADDGHLRAQPFALCRDRCLQVAKWRDRVHLVIDRRSCRVNQSRMHLGDRAADFREADIRAERGRILEAWNRDRRVASANRLRRIRARNELAERSTA